MQTGGAGQPTARWWALEQTLRAAGPLLWFTVAAVVIGYCGMPFSDHPDTLRDLLAARDCVERGDCAAEGATTSFANLHNGALWPFLLIMLRAAHLPSPTIWWLVLLADAVSITLVFIAVDRAARALDPAAQPAPHSAPVAHVATLASLAFLVVERTPNTVWSPALSPWFACLISAWWLHWRLTPPAWPWGPLVFGALLGLLADSHPATWPCAAAWVFVAALVDSRPLATLGWLAAGILATTGLLAPQTQLRNLHLLSGAASVTAVAIAAVAALFAGRRWLASGLRNTAAFGPLAAALGATALLATGTVAFGHRIEIRYLTPCLLTATIGLASLPWRTVPRNLPVALVLVVFALGGALRLGPGNVSMGHSWTVVGQVVRALDSAGIRYPASTTRIQGFGCKRLAAAVEVDAPTHPWMPTVPSHAGIQVLDLPANAETPAGWSLLERRVSSASWWRIQRLWLDTGKGRACLVGEQPRVCSEIRPGLWLAPDGTPAIRPGAPWHVRAMPESIALPTSATGSTTATIDLTITSDPGSSRTVVLLDSASAECPWTVLRSNHPGAQISDDRRSVLLPGTATPTTMTVAKTFNGRCSPLAAWGANPPCLLELTPPLPPLAAP